MLISSTVVTRRDFLRASGASVLACVVAGCAAPTATVETPSTDAGYPRTVETPEGAVRIERRPERVVCGSARMDLDPVVACGVVPIAYFDQSDYGLGPAPWTTAQAPNLRAIPATGLPVEQVVAERPDLLVAQSYLVEDTRDELTQVVPVLSAGNSTDSADGWVTTLDQVAAALGAEEAAARHKESVDQRLQALAAQVASLRDLRIATIYGYNGSIGQEARGSGTYAIFERLGLTLPDRLAAEPGFSVELSLEQVSEAADADVLLVADWSSNPDDETTQSLLTSPLFRRLPAVAAGKAARLEQQTTIGAYMLTALSIVPVAEQIVAALQRAATGQGGV